MIQGINSDYDTYYNVTAVAGTAVSQTSDSTDEKVAQGSQNTRTDTVEISPQARAAMQKANSVVSAGGKTSAQNSSEQTTGAGAPPPAAAEVSASVAVSSSDTSQQTDLSALTQAELDKLVSEGTITKAQEQAELARRSASAQQEQSDTAAPGTQASGQYQHAIDMYKSQAQIIGSGVTGENLLNSVA